MMSSRPRVATASAMLGSMESLLLLFGAEDGLQHLSEPFLHLIELLFEQLADTVVGGLGEHAVQEGAEHLAADLAGRTARGAADLSQIEALERDLAHLAAHRARVHAHRALLEAERADPEAAGLR